MKRILVLAVSSGLLASPVSAQSLFATRGLGIPSAPIDARSRALGGIGVGLLGLEMSLVNPAEVAGIGLRGVAATLQPATARPDVGGRSGSISGARFPMLTVVYPVRDRAVISLGFGSYLDQSWGVELSGQEIIGKDTIGVTDVIEANGAIARLTLGVAFQVTPSFAIGLGGGIHTGNLERRVSRSFSDSTSGLVPFDTRLRWDYHGAFGTVGARFDIASVVRLAGSMTISEKLTVDGRESTARDETADVPIRVTAGVSSALSGTFMVAAGFEWNGANEGRVFQAADADALQRGTWRYGGGIEYGGLRGGRRVFPIRMGANSAQLPYYDTGEDPARERSLALGMGFRLAEGAAGPLANADITVERGNRKGLQSVSLPGGLSESFWRISLSLSLFGN